MFSRHFTNSEFPQSVVQASTQASYDNLKGRWNRLIEAVVLRTKYSDDMYNLSSRWVTDRGVEGAGNVRTEENASGQLSPLYSYSVGYQVECDVLMMIASHRGCEGKILYNVPVMQKGGIRDTDIWTPKACTNFVQDAALNSEQLDGDRVVIGFLGGVFPRGAIIIGSAPHKRNFIDAPRSVSGTREVAKRIGDGKRKDGSINLVRYNGAVCPHIDKNGNVLFDTSEANHQHNLNIDSGIHTITQDNIPWTSRGNVAPGLDGNTPIDPTGNSYAEGMGDGNRDLKEVESPGGGDVVFKVKDTRRFRLEFCDNSKTVRDFEQANPRQFKETGFIQVHKNDGGSRVIEIAASDDVIINVRKYGDGNGTITINTEKTVDGITIGGLNLDKLATKEFVEKIFLLHNHMTGIGPTSTPIVTGAFTGMSTDDITGILAPQMIKVRTTKVRAE